MRMKTMMPLMAYLESYFSKVSVSGNLNFISSIIIWELCFIDPNSDLELGRRR